MFMLNEIIKLLKEDDRTNLVTFFQENAMVEVTRLELKKIIPVVQTDYGNIYQYSIQFSLHDLTEILINYDLIPKSYYERKRSGLSPLMLAVFCGNYNFVEQKMKAGADPNEYNKAGVEPREYNGSLISMSSANVDLKMMTLLLKHGANPNQPYPALLRVIQSHKKLTDINLQLEAITLLMAYGADMLHQVIMTESDRKSPCIEFNNKKTMSYPDYIRYKQSLTNPIQYHEQTLPTIEKEIIEIKQFKKNMAFIFWATKKDENSMVSNIDKDTIQNISSVLLK